MSEHAPLMDEALVRDVLYHLADLCRPAVRQRATIICFSMPDRNGIVAMRPPEHLSVSTSGNLALIYHRLQYLWFGARVGKLALSHRAVIVPDSSDEAVRGIQVQRHPFKAAGHYLDQPNFQQSPHSLAMSNGELTADLALLQRVRGDDHIMGVGLSDLELPAADYLRQGPTG